MTDFNSLIMWDLAAARLWVALRSVEAVNRYWPLWDVAALPVAPELIRETNPDSALISAMRTGARIKVFGVHDDSTEPQRLPHEAWPYARMYPADFAGNVGAIGPWRGITVMAHDLRKAFPVGRVRVTQAARAAELILINSVVAAEAGGAAVPVGAVWKREAPAQYGINNLTARKIWRKVAKDYPVLSDPRGKPKKRLCA